MEKHMITPSAIILKTHERVIISPSRAKSMVTFVRDWIPILEVLVVPCAQCNTVLQRKWYFKAQGSITGIILNELGQIHALFHLDICREYHQLSNQENHSKIIPYQTTRQRLKIAWQLIK